MTKKASIKPRTKAKLGAGLVQHRSKASGAGYKEITCALNQSRRRRHGSGLQGTVLPSATLVPCAFCKGKGKDPFGIPSKLSDCQTCWGKGKVAIADIPHQTCSACKGTGVFAHHRLSCSVCRGKGVVPEDRREGPKGMDPDTGLPEIGNY